MAALCAAAQLDWMAGSDPVYLFGDAQMHLGRARFAHQEGLAASPGRALEHLVAPTMYPEGMALLTGWCYGTFGRTYLVAWGVQQAFVVVLALSTYALGAGLEDRRTGLLAALLVLISPFLRVEGARYMLDLPLAALLTLAAAGWALSDRFRRTGPALLGTVAAMAAPFVKSQALLFLAAGALVLGAASARWSARERGRACAFLLPPLALAAWLPWQSRHLLEGLVVMSAGGGPAPAVTLFDYGLVFGQSLLGPVLLLLLEMAAVWHLARATRWRWALAVLALSVGLLAGFGLAKSRFVAPLLPLAALLVASFLRRGLDGRGLPWATALLLASLAWTWLPPGPAVEVEARSLGEWIHTDREYGPGRLPWTWDERLGRAWDYRDVQLFRPPLRTDLPADWDLSVLGVEGGAPLR